MVFELAPSALTLPEKTVVEAYGTFRLGAHPTASFSYTECEKVRDAKGVLQNTDFGSQAYVQSQPYGRRWTCTLMSSDPAAFARMQQMQFNIAAGIVTAALAKLGVTKTAAEIGTAVQAMFAEGNTPDSYIGTEGEKLEEDRRGGTFTPSTVVGDAP